MIVASAVTILGLLFGLVTIRRAEFGPPGVLVVPLVAVYGLYEFLAVPVLLASGAVAYVLSAVLERWTRLRGPQLLVVSMLAGLSTPFVLGGLSGAESLTVLPVIEIAALGGLVAGGAAAEYRQLEPARRRRDVLVSLGSLAGLFAIGIWLVGSGLAVRFGPELPPLLLGTDADVAAFASVTIESVEPTLVSPAVVLPLLAAGVLFPELGRKRWGIRLLGTAVVPLLALVALRHAIYMYTYVFLLPVVFASIDFVHRRTLLYGRCLLSVGVCAAVLASLPIAAVFDSLSGLYYLLVAALVGVGAYDLHRMPAIDRVHTLALSGGLFVASVAAIATVLLPAPGGLGAPFDPIELGGAAVLATGGLGSVLLLEYRRRTAPGRPGLIARLLGGANR